MPNKVNPWQPIRPLNQTCPTSARPAESQSAVRTQEPATLIGRFPLNRPMANERRAAPAGSIYNAPPAPGLPNPVRRSPPPPPWSPETKDLLLTDQVADQLYEDLSGLHRAYAGTGSPLPGSLAGVLQHTVDEGAGKKIDNVPQLADMLADQLINSGLVPRELVSGPDSSGNLRIGTTISCNFMASIKPDMLGKKHLVISVAGLTGCATHESALMRTLINPGQALQQAADIGRHVFGGKTEMERFGSELYQFTKSLQARYPDLEITIQGHSFGGVAAQRCFQESIIDQNPIKTRIYNPAPLPDVSKKRQAAFEHGLQALGGPEVVKNYGVVCYSSSDPVHKMANSSLSKRVLKHTGRSSSVADGCMRRYDFNENAKVTGLEQHNHPVDNIARHFVGAKQRTSPAPQQPGKAGVADRFLAEEKQALLNRIEFETARAGA